MLAKRASQLIREKLCISDNQGATCKGLSQINSSMLVQETISHVCKNDENLYVTFFDTKKAFDTVWLNGLFFMLFCAGIKGKLWRLLLVSYTNCFSSVFCNGKTSQLFKLMQGV